MLSKRKRRRKARVISEGRVFLLQEDKKLCANLPDDRQEAATSRTILKSISK